MVKAILVSILVVLVVHISVVHRASTKRLPRQFSSMAEAETTEQKLARLEAAIAALRQGQEINVTVTAPPARKLRKYSGTSSELSNWITDARSILPTIANADRTNFLLTHLEGIARDEIRFMPENERDSVDKIFDILSSAFGDTRSSALVKRELYDRMQGSKESVREYGRVLLEIAEGMKEGSEVRDKSVCEVFCENLYDVQIKREMKKMVRDDPTISFSKLRAEAIRLEEDGQGNRPSTARVREVSETHNDSVLSERIDKLALQLEVLASTQKEMISWMQSQRPQQPEVAKSGVPGGTSELTYSSRPSYRCNYCNKWGHSRRRCRKRISDMQHGTGQTVTKDNTSASGPSASTPTSSQTKPQSKSQQGN